MGLRRFLFAGFLCATVLGDSPGWVETSNRNARELLAVDAKFSPESAARAGLSGLDEQILDLKPQYKQRHIEALKDAAKTLSARLAIEKDPLVRQDLEILIHAAHQDARELELKKKYFIPYVGVMQAIYGGIHALLDDQIAPNRRPAALVRLRRYAGMEDGYTPLLVLAEERTHEGLNQPGLLGPAAIALRDDLAHTSFFLDGIAQLFTKYKIAGYEEPYARLRRQAQAYDSFVRKDLMARSRSDFRLPPDVYAFSLGNFGVDIPASELVAMAHSSFDQIQAEMQKVAVRVAKEKGYANSDYRAVIRELKKDQLVGEAIMPHYEKRLAQIEEIIRREQLVSMPSRPARMVIASAAETAQQPAPHMRAPRLIGNTGERGEFVLPLNIPTAPGQKALHYDDFTFGAASWTLIAHEVRPGHELQFDAMVERGVSLARALFAFNSANVEGWGLYAESIMLPYMPLEGQLVSLDYRLMRAARAFLDPELHMGKITPQEAMRVLREDVVVSEAMATQEVERYTFRSPAQATSYFYGFVRLNQLRADVEKALGPKFDRKKFHDFILSQGLLPPNMLRKAVFESLVGTPKT